MKRIETGNSSSQLSPDRSCPPALPDSEICCTIRQNLRRITPFPCLGLQGVLDENQCNAISIALWSSRLRVEQGKLVTEKLFPLNELALHEKSSIESGQSVYTAFRN